ncbi:N-acylneuraminate cytidylyltransferase A [Drosophila virilis]|uniref:N-acylneuraminate cytidylyltransferase n=1 Tax=Drosophila virilis TaxID=7244 RepID=B4LGF7_DROVI|nr:N-acylneuraminate cytidylyltransferase A isoform X1 [Drosophila virilis]EDW70486.2 uncharacterized protein Dvir_GJ11503 [Drosophila virilis]
MNAPIYWFLTFVLQCAIQVESNANCSTNDVHALILARGGSKGITYKNLVQIDGLSILSRAITTISNSSCFKHIWVSTDDEKIALEAKKYGAIVHIRPAKYALDGTSSIEAIQEFLEGHKAIDNFALFQCTSVFLKEKYIEEAYQKFKVHDCVFSVKRSHNLRWKYVEEQILPDNFNLKARPRRQDWKGDMVEAGMFYFSTRKLAMKGLLQNKKCDVVEIAAEDGLEIDSYQDLAIARCIINSNI